MHLDTNNYKQTPSGDIHILHRRINELENNVKKLKQGMSDIRNTILQYGIKPTKEIDNVLALSLQLDILEILERENK